VGLGIGVIGYFNLDFEPSFNKLLALTTLGALLVYLLRKLRIIAFLSVFLFTITIGALVAKIETLRLDTHIITSEIIVPITARVLAWEENQEKGNHRLIIRIVSASRESAALAGKKVRLSARSLPAGTEIGSGLNGLVNLRPPSGPIRFGAYDFSFHQFYRGLTAQGFFMGQPEIVALPTPQSLFERFDLAIAALRVKIGQHIEAAIEGEAGAIASALITGLRGGISEETTKALRLSGLAHILSISGLHMAMVTGMVLLIARAILGLFIHFSSRHNPKKIAAVIALGFAGFYLILSGSDIAAQRSFIMVAIMLLAVLCDRAAITIRNLSLSALIILCITPHEIFSPSFQMSYAATGALIALFGWWSKCPSHLMKPRNQSMIWRFLIGPALSTIAASLVAGSASGLFAAYHFANMAPLGLISNVAALPVMSVLVMFPALLTCIMMPFGFEGIPLTIMAVGIEWVKIISFQVTSITPEINPGMITPTTLIFSSLALIILLVMRSPLRLLAIFPGLIALIFYVTTPRPLVLIDEEARLIAVSTPSGKIALSTGRPSAFILSHWQTIFDVTAQNLILLDGQGGFSCRDLTCQVPMANAQIFATAIGKSGHDDACMQGDIILLDYISPIYETCGTGKYVITAQDLARMGAAMIIAPSADDYHILWAQGKSSRPWNAHRYSSKAALGMP